MLRNNQAMVRNAEVLVRNTQVLTGNDELIFSMVILQKDEKPGGMVKMFPGSATSLYLKSPFLPYLPYPEGEYLSGKTYHASPSPTSNIRNFDSCKFDPDCIN